MGLKYLVDSLDGIDDSVKGLYKENNGKFSLDVDLGDNFESKDQVNGLRSQRDSLLAEKKAAQAERDEVAANAKKIADEAARKNGDFEALHKSAEEEKKKYQEKLSAYEKKEREFNINKNVDYVTDGLAEGANKKHLNKLIRSRIDLDGERPVVLDVDGKPTVLSLSDLKKEIENDPDYDSLKIGSKATGSGASKSKSGGVSGKTMMRSEFDQIDHKQRAEFFKTGGVLVDD